MTGLRLFNEIKDHCYNDGLSDLYRLLYPWRAANTATIASLLPEAEAARAVDPATGRLIWPVTAASLDIEPQATLAAG